MQCSWLRVRAVLGPFEKVKFVSKLIVRPLVRLVVHKKNEALVMALTYDEAVGEIRKEVKDDSEKFILFDLATRYERYLRPLKASEVVPFLRTKRDSEQKEKDEQRPGQKRASETQVRKVAEEVVDALKAQKIQSISDQCCETW
jgi:hypothetical protein